VTTGTVLEGSVQAGDEVFFPELNFSKKVKSI
jgi:selenocysteine-specific translation elongation factor